MQQIGRYQIIERIGRGAMGVVYRALDPRIGRTIAVKSIRLGEISDASELKRLRDRLEREARSAGALSHPNIVTIYDILEEEKLIHLFMEYVNGPSLEKMLNEHRLPSKELTLSFLRQVGSALDYAHKVGIVHRDVKPSNLMLHFEKGTGEQLAKVTDFGVAKFVSQQMTQAGSMMGTPNYMAPEQIEGNTITGETDQFALASVAYEILTGRKPFSADYLPTLFFKIVRENPPAADQVNPTLSPEINHVLQRGLAKIPAERFESCSAFVSALVSACEAHPDWAPPYRLGAITAPAPEENNGATITTANTPISAPNEPSRFSFQDFQREKEAAALPVSSPAPIEEVQPVPFEVAAPPASPDVSAITPSYELPAGRRRSWEDEPEPSRPAWRKFAIAVLIFALAGIAYSVYRNSFLSDAPNETTQSTAPSPAVKQEIPPDSVHVPARNTKESVLGSSSNSARNHAPAGRPLPSQPSIVAKPNSLPSDAEQTPSLNKRSSEEPVEVQFTSDPVPGRVTVDNNQARTCFTPCVIMLMPGRHTLTVSAPNYGLARRIIQVPDQRSVYVPLSQEIGIIQVDSVPSGSKVFVDGRETGQTPTTLKLTAGPHQIRLANGPRSHQETIEVNPGGLQQFTFRWQ